MTIIDLKSTDQSKIQQVAEILVAAFKESAPNIAVTKERGIFIPNVFSPNADGINDSFYIMGRGYAQILVFQIFDRWGNLVFAQNQGGINDESIGWNGNIGVQNAENGVYSYYAKVIYLDEIEESFYGDVTLVR